ncbi:hypothetical protein N9H94_03615 [Akkermansiaceae bacterium]|nr:hypothetical protein [Akkermansiaceae bacterium]
MLPEDVKGIAADILLSRDRSC